MWWDGQASIALMGKIAHQRTAFGQHLIDVPIRILHCIKYAMDVLSWYVLVKQIAHRIDKDELRTSPVLGFLKAFGTKCEIKTRLKRMFL